MKTITLQKMEMTNFKGFKHYVFEPKGESVVMAGMNSTGKTSLKDAMLWLFFGKSSDGGDLSPKMLDQENKEILGLEPIVEATFLVDGEELKLKKELREKWTKPTGKSEKIFEGNKTMCFVDDVPKPVTQYKKFVNELINEDYFKALANTGYFMSDKFKWDKRRELLVDMVGLSDDDIINSEESLSGLKDILGKHTIDDARDMFKAMRTKNKGEIDRLPIAIQENQAMVDELMGQTDVKKATIQKNIKSIDKEIAEQEAVISEKRSAGNANELEKQIIKLKNKGADERNKFGQSLMLETDTLNNDFRTLQNEVSEIASTLNAKKDVLRGFKSDVDNKSEMQKRLRDEWMTVNQRQFSKDKTICSCCGQSLPANKVEDMEKDFNEIKVGELRKIENKVSENEYTDEAINSIKEMIKAVESEIEAITSDYNAKVKQKDSIKEEIDKIVANQPKFEESDKAVSIANEIKDIQSRIELEKDSISEIVAAEVEKLDKLREKSRELQSKLSVYNQIESLESKIEKYREQDAELKNQALDISSKLSLIDDFTRIKSNKVEDSINGKFKHVKFKLFEPLQNGGLKETCEAMIDNGTSLVGYSQGLNNGARMLADIDIVNTLSNEFGFKIPMFVDNAEGLTSAIETDTQVIRLHVTFDDALTMTNEKDFILAQGGVK